MFNLGRDEPQKDSCDSRGSGSTMAAELAAIIRADIIRGRLAPGEKLKIQCLAVRYQAGTVPIREALSRLVSGGFVVAVDQRGFRVKGVSQAELADLTRVRLMVERTALRDSLEHCDLPWEERLLSSHHRMSQLRIHEGGIHTPQELNTAWEAAHDDFHKQLISNCTSPWLIQFASTLRDQTARYRHVTVTSVQTAGRDVQAEHRAILDACLRHKIDLAAALLCDHLSMTAEMGLTAIAGMPGVARLSGSATTPLAASRFDGGLPPSTKGNAPSSPGEDLVV